MKLKLQELEENAQDFHNEKVLERLTDKELAYYLGKERYNLEQLNKELEEHKLELRRI